MKTHSVTGILAMTVLLFSTGAMAERMSKTEYRAAGKNIAAEYKINHESCISYAHNKYKRSCLAEANSTQKAEAAELDARYKSLSEPAYAMIKRR
jgi:hypothetical protein